MFMEAVTEVSGTGAGVPDNFFRDVKYFACGTLSEKVVSALESHGAKKTSYLSGINSHCIVGTDPDYTEISEATDMLDVPAVREDWVMASVLCKAILPLKAFSPSTNQLFGKVRACLSGSLSAADTNLLWALLTFHGGQVTKVLSESVSHLVVLSTTDPLLVSDKSGRCVPVTPDWITDSVSKGAQLPDNVYHPRLLLPPDRPKPTFGMAASSTKKLPTAMSDLTSQAERMKMAGTPRSMIATAQTRRLPGPPTIGTTPKLPGPPTMSNTPRPLLSTAGGAQMRPGGNRPPGAAMMAGRATTDAAGLKQQQTPTTKPNQLGGAGKPPGSNGIGPRPTLGAGVVAGKPVVTTISASQPSVTNATTSAPSGGNTGAKKDAVNKNASGQMLSKGPQSTGPSTTGNSTVSTTAASVPTSTATGPAVSGQMKTGMPSSVPGPTSSASQQPPLSTVQGGKATAGPAVPQTGTMAAGKPGPKQVVGQQQLPGQVSQQQAAKPGAQIGQMQQQPGQPVQQQQQQQKQIGQPGQQLGQAAQVQQQGQQQVQQQFGGQQQQASVQQQGMRQTGQPLPQGPQTGHQQQGGQLGQQQQPQGQKPEDTNQQQKPQAMDTTPVLRSQLMSSQPIAAGLRRDAGHSLSSILAGTPVSQIVPSTTSASGQQETTASIIGQAVLQGPVTSAQPPTSTAPGQPTGHLITSTGQLMTTSGQLITTSGQQTIPQSQAIVTGQQQSQPQQTVTSAVNINRQQHISRPAILQPHEQFRPQQPATSVGMQQQQWQQRQPDGSTAQQFVRPAGQPVIQQQQMWQQGMIQQRGLVPGGVRPPPNINQQRQQQLIQQHLAQLSPEQRQHFSNMSPRDKQQYLAQRGLFPALNQQQWPGGQAVQLHRNTIQLTEQQKQMLQSMDPQQRTLYVQKLQKEREAQIRAAMMQQRQQQPIMAGGQVGQPQGTLLSGAGTVISQHQQGQAGQQPGGAAPQQWQATPGQLQQQPNSNQQQTSFNSQSPSRSPQSAAGMSPLHHQQAVTSPVAGGMPVSVAGAGANMQTRIMTQQSGGQVMAQQTGGQVMTAGGPMAPTQVVGTTAQQQQVRPSWTGETHPALAQVPRTPQQIQHLQRLQMQRQQQMGEQQQSQQQAQALMAVDGQQQQQAVAVSSVGGIVATPQQQVIVSQQQQASLMVVGNGQNQTKVALQNMLSSRLVPAPNNPAMSMPGDGSQNRMQMMNQHHLMQQQQQHMLAMQQRNSALRDVTNVPHQPAVPIIGGSPGPMQVGMGGARFAGRAVLGGPGGLVRHGLPPQHPRMPQFIGHSLDTRLPPDLCLYACIFFFVDYQDHPDLNEYVPSWKKTITQYGGEVETTLTPRVTHALCHSQKSPLAQQARMEGRRLVSIFWLNDTVKRKKVLPPWKAIHFPLPANFEPPCTNMIIALTGFEDRDRDYVKEMITMTGAKYTSYFSKHNHAIICKAPTGIKHEKAKEWKIPAVSVLWLNDVLFGSVNGAQSLSNTKYQTYKPEEPLRVDYSLVAHLLQAWKIPLRLTPETSQNFKANPPARIKRKAERQRQEKDAEEKRRKYNEERATQGLPPLNMGDWILMENLREVAEVQAKMKNNPTQNGSSSTDKPTSPDTVDMVDPVTGESVAVKKEESEESAPEQPAKDDEPEKMDVDEDKEEKVKNGKENKENEDADKEISKDIGIKKEPGEEDVEKKTPIIMFSAMDKYQRHELNATLVALSGEYTMDPASCTHLIMGKMARSEAFLLCLPTIKYILRPDWIHKSKLAGKWLPEEDFIYVDKEFEEMFECNIREMLKNEKRTELFVNKVFFVTPSVLPRRKVLDYIITKCGGKVERFRRKEPAEIREMNKTETNYMIITCLEDIHLVTDILQAKLEIYTVELIVCALLTGQMNFDMTRYITTVNHSP